MQFRVQFNKQPIVTADSWEDAQFIAAKELIEAVRECDDSKPVEALLALGFSVSVRNYPQ